VAFCSQLSLTAIWHFGEVSVPTPHHPVPGRGSLNSAADRANRPTSAPICRTNLVLARDRVHRLTPLVEAGNGAKLVGKTAEIVGDRGRTAGSADLTKFYDQESSTNYRRPNARRSRPRRSMCE
jgi:hypothetical protein